MLDAPAAAMLLLFSIAGAVGCAARAALRELALRRGIESWRAILAANLVGSLVIGAVGTLAADDLGPFGAVGAFGFLSGWTTYSAFALDVVSLWHQGRRRAATLLWGCTILGAPTLAGLGAFALRGAVA